MEEKFLEREWLTLVDEGLVPRNSTETQVKFFRLLFISGAVSVIGLLAVAATSEHPSEDEILKGVSIQKELEEFILQAAKDSVF